MSAMVLDPRGDDRALCREIGPDLWFPEQGESSKEVKAACGRCSIRDACLNYSLDNEEMHGVWGGVNERDRRKIIRSRRRGAGAGQEAA